MKKALFATALLASSIFTTPAVFAQEGSSTAPVSEYSNTMVASPAPVEKTDVNVNVEAPATRVVQAPAPDVNVHVDSPVSAPATSTEKTTKETSVTRVVQTPATPDDSNNMIFLLVGGGIAALAVAGLFTASQRS